MPYTQDWHSRHIPHWTELFTRLGWVGKPNLHFLEIGCFEGRATVWLLEQVLTHPTSRIEVIDTFEGSEEHDVLAPGTHLSGLYRTFDANIAAWGPRAWGGTGQVSVHCGASIFELAEMYSCEYGVCGDAVFDFAYIDGSHRASDVLTDACLAWPLLKPGGVLLFDDNGWEHELPSGEVLCPAVGIQAFLNAFAGQYEPLVSGAQIGVRKLGAA